MSKPEDYLNMALGKRTGHVLVSVNDLEKMKEQLADYEKALETVLDWDANCNGYPYQAASKVLAKYKGE